MNWMIWFGLLATLSALGCGYCIGVESWGNAFIAGGVSIFACVMSFVAGDGA